MKSAVATTMEIDDMRIAAKELAESVRAQISLQKNSCGLLYYDYEVDGDVLSSYLTDALDMPIMGCSAIAMLDNHGYHEMEAMLMVMTDDICEFSMSLSAPLDMQTAGARIAAAYQEAAAKLTTTPCLIYALAPDGIGMTFDRCLESLSEASGRLPVLGGINSTTGDLARAVVFEGRFSTCQAALLVIGGALRPVCSLVNVSSQYSNRAGKITKAQDEIIYEVDGMPFADFIESFGLDIDSIIDDANRVFYQNYPLLVEGAGKDADGVNFLRIIRGIDRKDGSADAYAGFPPGGGTVCLGMFEREEIRRSVELGLAELLRKMAENETDEYRYSTVLCVSCAARHAIMNPRYDVEGKVIEANLPPSLSLGGFYSHGELCPTSISKERAFNRLHNGSIVFCGF